MRALICFLTRRVLANDLGSIVADSFWNALAASLLACATTTIAIFLVRSFRAQAEANSSYFASFAAGALVSVSFLHIAPTSLRMNAQAPLFLLAGFLALHMLNRFITAYVCDRPTTADYAIGLVPLIGIGLHSLIDGAIYSVTFAVDVRIGVAAAVGTILHEFPEGVVTYTLMLRGGFSERQALFSALVAAALTTPLGMLASYPWISRVAPSMLGALLALSAGALFYVGASHLLPHAEREHRPFSLLALFAGVLVAAGIVITHH